mmetsp:Transcript_1962/g.7200  ORF Transcript_1962/g.7200 Transcript_1962/m.7200 type:complete len:159 (+) Transcript_1962:577-1053(+)
MAGSFSAVMGALECSPVVAGSAAQIAAVVAAGLDDGGRGGAACDNRSHRSRFTKIPKFASWRLYEEITKRLGRVAQFDTGAGERTNKDLKDMIKFISHAFGRDDSTYQLHQKQRRAAALMKLQPPSRPAANVGCGAVQRAESENCIAFSAQSESFCGF